MPERLPRALPASMTPEQVTIYERFTGGRRAEPRDGFSLVHEDGGLVGPPNAWLLSPPLGAALERIGAAVRFELQLSERVREIAILCVAVSCQSDFEIETHVRAARAVGLGEAEIAALLSAKAPTALSDDERMAHSIVSALVRSREVSDELYARGVETLGERVIFELVTLVGYYELVALQMKVFGTGNGPSVPTGS